ncbi:MAG: hypothetical protein LBB41_07400 [Prevotellaceae bacterium]|jgi:hypothetical protein|nr:hypothetical protein [Prevotellaceae bacterium]
MKVEIVAWLSGARNYGDGVALYDKYGFNRNLKQNFQKHTGGEYYENILLVNLCKIARISDKELHSIKRMVQVVPHAPIKEPPIKDESRLYFDDLLIQAAQAMGLSVDAMLDDETPKENITEQQSATLEEMRLQYAKVPETVKKVIRFREQFPYLDKDECPNELKLLVTEMFFAYDKYRAAFDELGEDKTSDENLKNAQAVVENYLNNRAIWDELEYYKANGTVLGEHPVFNQKTVVDYNTEVKKYSDIELSKKLANAQSRVSQLKKSLKNATDDEKRAKIEENLKDKENVVALLLAELELRKNVSASK